MKNVKNSRIGSGLPLSKQDALEISWSQVRKDAEMRGEY